MKRFGFGRRGTLVVIAAGATAAVAAPRVAELRPRDIAARVVEAPVQLAEVPAQAVTAVVEDRTGRHLGFDTNIYPGDGNMRAWKADSPYEWVGYYLPAPCHKDHSWSGRREVLEGMGWGLAVIYVGQQTWGKNPGEPHVVTKYVRKRVPTRVARRVRVNGRMVTRYTTRYVTRTVPVRTVEAPRATPGSSCSAQFVSGSRGTKEADDAIARTQREGFPRGTVIFLDVERMDQTPKRMREYYSAWVKRVLEDGRYRPGIYAHTHNAPLIYRDVKGVYASLGAKGEPSFWIAGGRRFGPDKAPTDVGHAFAAVWQGVLDTYETRAGSRLQIDINVASVRSPSSHEYAVTE